MAKEKAASVIMKHGALPPVSDINVTPMVDVMLVMLIIFMVMTRDGKSYLNTTQMAPSDLPAKVKDLLLNRLDKTVFVKADSRARYEKVVEVVDNLRAAGVDQLGLLTEQILDTTKPNPSGGAK